MILPIHTYGSKVLRRKAVDIPVLDDTVRELVSNMFETMYFSEGIGLAAPQIGESLRLFIIDISPMDEKESKRVYINARILEYNDESDEFEEGCLSIPTIREIVRRPTRIRIQYQDIEGVQIDEVVEGFLARVIQHEYDHLEGILFTDRLSTLKRSMLKKTLKKIAAGEIEVEATENFEL